MDGRTDERTDKQTDRQTERMFSIFISLLPLNRSFVMYLVHQKIEEIEKEEWCFYLI